MNFLNSTFIELLVDTNISSLNVNLMHGVYVLFFQGTCRQYLEFTSWRQSHC